uniref:Uncharacterized protein n=1 Tax=Oryza rufipogon TaxID=4529 RepID=A0A0E0QNN2_ORYRU
MVILLKIMETPQIIPAKRDHRSCIVLLHYSRKISLKRLTTIICDEWLRGWNFLLKLAPVLNYLMSHEGGHGNEPLIPTGKTFRHPFGPIIEGYGILRGVLVRHNDVEAILDYHVFEVSHFDIFIGHDRSERPQKHLSS